MGYSVKVRNNVELLKAMDTIVRFLNDEDGIEGWLMVGVPDGAVEEDYEFIANDDECMEYACQCFGRTMRRYSKHGWFTNYGGEPPFKAYGSSENYSMEANEMLDRLPWDVIEHYMDKDIAEELHTKLAPCSNDTFLAEYMAEHAKKYRETFTIN